MKPLETRWPDPPKFDIRCDIYGRGEPEVVLFKPGTMTEAETIPLPEAERRGIVSTEQADHARAVNQRIRDAAKKVREKVERGKAEARDRQR